MDIWTFISEKIHSGARIFLLYVLESQGSSPGRRGFKMAVASDGSFTGTIGGGIMEFKMVEKAKALLSNGQFELEATYQYHDKAHGTDQSGMICSGSQFLVFVPLSAAELPFVQSVMAALREEKPVSLRVSPEGISLAEYLADEWEIRSEKDWISVESLKKQPVIHIIGGGHVSLALSELMRYLGFYIFVYDDRPGLSTLEENHFADEKFEVDYNRAGDWLKAKSSDFVVIMTVGYRTDKLILRQLLGKKFFYLGMLGSEKKIETLMAELKAEGFEEEDLAGIHAPIGLMIYSQTTREIAVSIAAEIIMEKNKNLPGGRGQK
jgi:xanthine dehydrogenase accessory factor